VNSIERRLNAIVNNTTMAIFLMDERQHCIFMNHAAEELTGYREEEAVGRPLHDVVHHQRPDGTAYPIEECPIGQAFPERERMQGEEVFVHKDGHFFPVAFTASPIGGEDGQPVGTIIEVRDITEEKRNAAALRESESRFRNMADHAPVMMWVTGPTGFCTYLNRHWYQFTGQTAEEARGFGWLEATHPDDRQRAEDAFTAANADRASFRVEYRLRHASGGYRWAIDAASPRFDEDGEYLGYVGTVIDIHERREAEERLALREEQLRLALDVAEIGQWDVDLSTGGMFWPPRVKTMFGISPDAPVTLDDFNDGLHPDDREKTRIAFESARDPDLRALYDVEYRTVGKEDGVVRWVAAKGRGLFNAEGVCFRVIGTAIDITARKAAEIRLHQLNERLEHEVAERTAERNRVWEMSRDLLAIMGFDGLLKAINPAWETTLGRDAETLLALSFREQVHPDDHLAVQEVLVRLLRGETVERFEDRLAHADGTWRWISWTLVPEGDVFYAVGRDVTPEKEAAEELEHAQQALRQSQKMEAMGQLTGGVAHDFNNLLTPIVGSLDLLQRKGVGGAREQRLIEGAIQSADRARTLVQRLLAFARRQPLQSTAVDIGNLVEGMADLLASTTGPQVRVVVDVADDLPPAEADPNQLEMALLNLGVNARDAMPHGGTLRITATQDHVRAARGALKRGRYVRLSVADTGVGMDEATLSRAVEPFFSTKGVGKGTGLGLSMAHGLAAQLGGALTIHSRQGVGTNVEFWLPVSTTAPAVERSPTGPVVGGAARGLALLVDDEDVVRASTADMLEELGYEVREAESGEAALSLVAQGLTPDLLVTDHLMPGMTGVDLASTLRAQFPELPVLVVSGYAEVEGLTSGLPRLTKPFRSAELAASLASLMPGSSARG
jgi:PAS domain S-box-containing protein